MSKRTLSKAFVVALSKVNICYLCKKKCKTRRLRLKEVRSIHNQRPEKTAFVISALAILSVMNVRCWHRMPFTFNYLDAYSIKNEFDFLSMFRRCLHLTNFIYTTQNICKTSTSGFVIKVLVEVRAKTQYVATTRLDFFFFTFFEKNNIVAEITRSCINNG